MHSYLLFASIIGCSRDSQSYANETQVAALEEQLLLLQEQLAVLEESCVNQSELVSLTESVNENTQNISDIDAELETLSASSLGQDDISHLVTQEEFSTLQTTVETHGSDLLILQSDISNHASAVASLESSVAVNETTIASNLGGIAANQSAIASLQTDLGTLQSQVAGAETSIQQNMSSIVNHSASLSALQTSMTNAESDISDHVLLITDNADDIDVLESDMASLLVSITAIESDYVTSATLAAQWISTDTTWVIGPSSSANFATLHDAVRESYQYKIHPDAVLTLSLEAGTHTYTESLDIRHDHGNRMEIVGDIAQPGAYILEFTGSDANYGIGLFDGSHLRTLSGFTLKGDNTNTNIGLFVHQNSSVDMEDMIIEGWAGAGIYAQNNATVYAPNGSMEIRNNASRGIMSRFSSLIRIDDANIHNNAYGADTAYSAILFLPNADVYDHSGFGLSASWNSMLYMREGSSNNNGTNGYQISYGSTADLYLSEAVGNGVFGFNSYSGGLILAQSTSATDNTGFGYSAGTHSWIDAYGSTTSGNGTDYNVGSTDNGYNTLISQ
ncbi:MAG: right-handed parallel beta-helix repeat-containing protein [Myxococcota bacterium]|nr:right-handed parallel beta-helix repeat-containing protein [Myxococcota bacterium]